MLVIYYICTSEHIFSTKYCPFDGWENKYFVEINQIAENIKNNNLPLTTQTLQDHGLNKEIVENLLIIDFGSKNLVFDGLWPKKYYTTKNYPANFQEQIIELIEQERKNLG
jgi:hypothetical protein